MNNPSKRVEVFSSSDHREARAVMNLLEGSGVFAFVETAHPEGRRKFVEHRVYVHQDDRDVAKAVMKKRSQILRKEGAKELLEELMREIPDLTFDTLAFIAHMLVSTERGPWIRTR